MLFPILGFAQTSLVRGTVRDKVSEDVVPGALVSLGGNYKVLADDNGAFSFKDVPYGKYNMVVAAYDFDTVKIGRAHV